MRGRALDSSPCPSNVHKCDPGPTAGPRRGQELETKQAPAPVEWASCYERPELPSTGPVTHLRPRRAAPPGGTPSWSGTPARGAWSQPGPGSSPAHALPGGAWGGEQVHMRGGVSWGRGALFDTAPRKAQQRGADAHDRVQRPRGTRRACTAGLLPGARTCLMRLSRFPSSQFSMTCTQHRHSTRSSGACSCAAQRIWRGHLDSHQETKPGDKLCRCGVLWRQQGRCS